MIPRLFVRFDSIRTSLGALFFWTKHLGEITQGFSMISTHFHDAVNSLKNSLNLNSKHQKIHLIISVAIRCTDNGKLFCSKISRNAVIDLYIYLTSCYIINFDQRLTRTIVNLLLLSLIIIKHQSLDFFLLLLLSHLPIPDVSRQSRAERNLEIC